MKKDLKQFMEKHRVSHLKIKQLAALSGRSISTFNRDFRKLYGSSPHKWLLKNRLDKSKELLLTTPKNTSQVYIELGFKDIAHFSRAFKKRFGIVPSAVKKIK